ncbi:ABC transporter substrate-binding protein [Bosea rubneri]|uniref:ABC transporter substrate-binding protein n=1 Tax=Bosea rubneri TaxID=3075434 RepID=A0ABU3SDK6_9HYPH|nr:ABC transporter substrate-binding protein [Bosea sp. ZW T0_25]MDU0342878.1 ABC transporter substrate-binding protein [Bosea sp. ZW T0_25]
MELDRRAFLTLAAASALGTAGRANAAAFDVTDMLGRTVTLPGPPKRIVLLEARDILTMAMLHPEPWRLVVGWAATERIDSDRVRQDYQDGGEIPLVGKQSPDTVSFEGLLSLAPDLVVATSYMEPGDGAGLLAQRLKDAGISVVFSNSFDNRRTISPLDEMAPLMRMWGAILDRRNEAEAFLAFHQQHAEHVRRLLDGVAPRKTYFEVGSLYDDCCWAVGTSIWGTLLTAAGGRPLDAVSTPWAAKIQLEQVLAEGAEVYIATGGGFASATRPGIGPGLSEIEARNGLRRLTQRTGFQLIEAVKKERVHGIWTGLITTPPLNVLFLEVAAKWLHPQRCQELDPTATLGEINRRFLPKPIPGPLWISLDPEPKP